MKTSLIVIVAVLISGFTIAASVDTATIYSPAMHKNIKCVVIKPATYQDMQKRFPVVYLLHGYGDIYSQWVRRVPAIKEYADQMKIMIVCPDGGISSWYFDSPIDSDYRYDTHISKEVVKYIDEHYRTIPDRQHRAITGLSMGGHGALYLALRHPEIFGAAGSMSGGVDLRPFPNGWDISKRIGNAITNKENWQNMSVITMVEKKQLLPVSMMIDCGTDDFFYHVNQQLHQKMLELKIPHDYIERPGSHSWEYWENAIEYQLVFFKNHF
ncbi:MAG: alpha/beta hydrolase [Bacteroidales bacterium]